MNLRLASLLLFCALVATACSGSPQLPPEVPAALRAARCTEAVLDGVDLEALTLSEALALGARLKACLPKRAPAEPAPAADAGA